MHLVTSFVELVQQVAPVFTVPTFNSFLTVVTGWVFARRRVITRMIEAADAVETKHHSAFHRVFSAARWSLDELGLAIFGQLTLLRFGVGQDHRLPFGPGCPHRLPGRPRRPGHEGESDNRCRCHAHLVPPDELPRAVGGAGRTRGHRDVVQMPLEIGRQLRGRGVAP